MSYIVATFYKFVRLPNVIKQQSSLLNYCQQQGIKGSILLAEEGINGTIAGSPGAIDAVLGHLKSDPHLADLTHKESHAMTQPFDRLKVRLKQEIVTLGVPGVDPNQQVGRYVTPQEWNELISDPDVILIDTRNAYEVSIGTFKNAQNPQTHSFREFPEYVRTHLNPAHHKKVALFCTGGIRCEKATSFMVSQGFSEVYHLQGGILKYLEEVPAEQSLWQGECFVFDQRVAVKHGLEAGSYAMCVSCGHPISEQDKASLDYQEGISCPHCVGDLTEEKRRRQTEKHYQMTLATHRRNQFKLQ